MDRQEISELIKKRLDEIGINFLKKKYENSSSINYLIIDHLLPNEIASKLHFDFPEEKELNHLNGPSENKYVGVNFSDRQKLVQECLYAFQEESIIKIIGQITNIKDLIGDHELYAGGISSMSKGCYLNPHIDNSHDRNLKNFRRLNILYYVNKDWIPKKDGGELVLYPNGIKNKEEIINCKFNRLLIMRTDNKSIHGVKKVRSKIKRRKCISNYYFSINSPSGKKYYHSTSFRGFKKELVKGTYLQFNSFIRTSVKKFIFTISGKSISTNYHKKSD